MKIYIGRYPSKRVTKRNPDAEQKVDIRIDPWDVWNMAETLADIVLPMLKMLRNNKHGSPGSMPAFSDDSGHHWPQQCFDFYEEDDAKASDLGHKQWAEIMDKMIWSFEQIVERDRDSKFHSGETDFYFDPIKNDQGKTTLYEMKKGPKDTHKFDYEAYKAYYVQIQEGLDLFAKYYMNLWD